MTAEIVSLAERQHHRREGYRVVITPGLWRGYDVEVRPPTSTHPLQHLKTYQEAMGLAQALQRAEGWPIFSHVPDDGPTGGRAA